MCKNFLSVSDLCFTLAFVLFFLIADILHFYMINSVDLCLCGFGVLCQLGIAPHLKIRKRVFPVSPGTLRVFCFIVSSLICVNYSLCQVCEVDPTFSPNE